MTPTMYYLDSEDQGASITGHPGWVAADTGKLLTDAELAQHGFRIVVDVVPDYDPARQTVVQNPVSKWHLGTVGQARVTYEVTNIPVDVLLARRLAEVTVLVNTQLAGGYNIPGTGLFVDMADTTRADLSGMALFATLGLGWPEEYKQGWITASNERYPLPTPEVGLDLAVGVAAAYSSIRQRARTIKDDLIAASKEGVDALLTYDINSHWLK